MELNFYSTAFATIAPYYDKLMSFVNYPGWVDYIEKIIKLKIKGIDNALDRLKNHPDLKTKNRLKEEGENLRDRLKKSGSAEASHLFFIGKK